MFYYLRKIIFENSNKLLLTRFLTLKVLAERLSSFPFIAVIQPVDYIRFEAASCPTPSPSRRPICPIYCVGCAGPQGRRSRRLGHSLCSSNMDRLHQCYQIQGYPHRLFHQNAQIPAAQHRHSQVCLRPGVSEHGGRVSPYRRISLRD